MENGVTSRLKNQEMFGNFTGEEFTRSRGIVGEKTCEEKPFIIKFVFGSTPVFVGIMLACCFWQCIFWRCYTVITVTFHYYTVSMHLYSQPRSTQVNSAWPSFVGRCNDY